MEAAGAQVCFRAWSGGLKEKERRGTYFQMLVQL